MSVGNSTRSKDCSELTHGPCLVRQKSFRIYSLRDVMYEAYVSVTNLATNMSHSERD
jgi:hypothetical protein